jgi:hypothetical protein
MRQNGQEVKENEQCRRNYGCSCRRSERIKTNKTIFNGKLINTLLHDLPNE